MNRPRTPPAPVLPDLTGPPIDPSPVAPAAARHLFAATGIAVDG